MFSREQAHSWNFRKKNIYIPFYSFKSSGSSCSSSYYIILWAKMSFNLWERLKWFYLFIYLISWHSNLTFSFRGALYKDNRGPTPAKTALELAEIRSLFTAAAWHFSLVTRLHLSGIRRVWRALEGEGHFPFRGPALKDKTLLTALSNSENLAIICQTKERARGYY